MTHSDSSVARLVDPGRLVWFVNPSTMPPTPLGFVRDSDGGAFAIGGPTGSHMTGHIESWWDKLGLIAAQGYLPVELAIERRIISTDWSPPELSESDKRILVHIRERGA